MQGFLGTVAGSCDYLVPVAAIWAVACLYTLHSDSRCRATECGFFVALLLIAVCTIRTVLSNEPCWLLHTASLGIVIVAGVLRRPASKDEWLEWEA